tara:strand:- start:818 stop:1054 length:237 start_codon:yes stop_codon:yes gene_type:complete
MQYPEWYIEQQAMIRKRRDMERLYNKASAINDHFIIKTRDYEEYVDANIAWVMEMHDNEFMHNVIRGMREFLKSPFTS